MTFWVAGATVVGGLISSSSASDAADAQRSSAAQSDKTTRDIYNSQVRLLDPTRRMGLGAGNKLMTYLGIKPGAAATDLNGNPIGGLDRNQLRQQLLPKYTTGPAAGPSGPAGPAEYNPMTGQWEAAQTAGGGVAGTPSTVDEAGLNAEIDRQIAAQQQEQDQGYGDPNDPEFGSLMRDPTLADLQLDPGYQFRLQQGQQGLERSAAARGGLMSGRAAKDMVAYSQGAASQEVQNAFNRFNINRDNKLKPLQALMGGGQTSSSQLSTDAGNAGKQISSSQTDAGNVTAASKLYQGNIWQNALNQGASQYKQQQPQNKLAAGPDSWNSTW